MDTDNEWHFYQESLAGNKPEAHEGEIHSGFYRTARYDTVAFWKEGGRFLAVKSGKPLIDPNDMADLFLQVARFPLQYDVYLDACAGKPWPHEIVPEAPPPIPPIPVEDRPTTKPGIGHNKPPDEFTLFADEVSAYLLITKSKEAAGAPTTAAEADAYANLANRLQNFEKDADRLFEAEKAPTEKTLADTRKKWLPLINDLAGGKKRLKTLVGTWQRLERDRRDNLIASLPPGAARSARISSGTFGSIVLREFRSAKIVDYPDALKYFADHPKVKQLIQDLANNCAASAAKLIAPGCELVIEERAA